LSVAGNELHITIPEKWLGEAKYPVVVDPTIGTTTVGSFATGPDPDNDEYDRPWIENQYAFNKYLVPQNGNGVCTAFVYCYNYDTDNYATPCIYSNENNKPFMKISGNENEIIVWVDLPKYPVGWKSGSFTLGRNITAGEYIVN
jgi:hypothetical protein